MSAWLKDGIAKASPRMIVANLFFMIGLVTKKKGIPIEISYQLGGCMLAANSPDKGTKCRLADRKKLLCGALKNLTSEHEGDASYL